MNYATRAMEPHWLERSNVERRSGAAMDTQEFRAKYAKDGGWQGLTPQYIHFSAQLELYILECDNLSGYSGSQRVTGGHRGSLGVTGSHWVTQTAAS